MTGMILWLSMIWLPAFIGIIQINEAKFKKNIAVGVTIPEEGQNDPGVLNILNQYKKHTIAAVILCTITAVAGMFIPTSYRTTVFMIWTLFAIIFPMIPFIYANLRLKDYKKEKGWIREKKTVYVDTGAIENFRLLSPWLFVPPVFICLIPLIYERNLILLYVLYACICASFWFGYRYLYRSKAEMFNENTDITNALSRMRRYNWGKVWLFLSYGMAFTCAAMSVPSRYQNIALITSTVLMFGLCFYAISLEMKTRKIQEKLTAESSSEWYVDEDDHWLLGLFYYNPDDSHLIINQRTGMNTTINMARPAGKVLMIIAALMIAGLPFMGMFIDSMGNSPIEMNVTETECAIKSGVYHYEISLDEISDTELLDTLPHHLSRKMGTAIEHLLEGNFSCDEYPAVKLLLDPDYSPYILIETENGKYYLFNTREPETTRQIYEELNR